MDLRAELLRFDPHLPLDRAWTPPSTWYTAPEVADLERRAVFPSTWQPVARAADLAQVGAYASGCLAGEPWVVVRTPDGLRAFRNVCRHRGREVVTGSGTAEALVCGYHAWRYGLDGRLRSAPGLGAVKDFDRAAMGLVPLGLCTWGPWVFVQRDTAAPALAEQVPVLTERLDASGWGALDFAGDRTWIIDCNWKVYVDNYLDGGYHIAHMHPSLDAQLDMSGYRTELLERCSIQTAPPRRGPATGLDYDPAARIGDQALYAWLYPNFMVNRYGPCLDTNHVLPLGAHRCAVHYQFFFAPGHDLEPDTSMAQSDTTQLEDIEICASVQRGIGSIDYDRGRYALVEKGEHHFHGLLHADLLGGLASSHLTAGPAPP